MIRLTCLVATVLITRSSLAVAAELAVKFELRRASREPSEGYELVKPSPDNRPLYVANVAELTSDDVVEANHGFDSQGNHAVDHAQRQRRPPAQKAEPRTPVQPRGTLCRRPVHFGANPYLAHP
jgi:hypothetical protein